MFKNFQADSMENQISQTCLKINSTKDNVKPISSKNVSVENLFDSITLIDQPAKEAQPKFCNIH